MTSELPTVVERNAEKAESLGPFSGIKVLHTRKEVEKILANIGMGGIFDQYTKHDISHIDQMLLSIESIVPEATKLKLTPAEWLMLTLAVYFHDLGMLVTEEEFSRRSETGFPDFRRAVEDGSFGLSFKEKVNGMGSVDQQDRFIYQEMVRRTHAERVRYWILEECHPQFSTEKVIVGEVKKLLENLDPLFRRDLSIICESHHQNDLDDFGKYKTTQHYGPTKGEQVNLHYCALVLRTADLLHITSDRTPSVEFRLINPSDPVSQEEWAKQRSVKSVTPKAKKNREGVLDPSIQADTFEVTAYFRDENGFFGLVSYLDYARKQLQENFKFNEKAKRENGSEYEYPWREIDDSLIETANFEKKQFEFVLDQTRILDLLVGHTLYNDSTVVLRELIQNSIDATKLKKHELRGTKLEKSYEPQIEVNWSESVRDLEFVDNGTGMTIEIIQNHLLKVGSSRYQEEDFKKTHPDFSPISRFGIGLLTCFLIADDIDILTKSAEMDKSILLKIKKIHGKYLLKYQTKEQSAPEIWPHGTKIVLHVRPEVKLTTIERELRKWILIPNTKVKLRNDGTESVIGYKDPIEVLTSSLVANGYDVDGKQIRVEQFEHEGVTLAFALKYIEHLQEWSFLEYHEVDRVSFSPVGTSIEGIRVEFNTPGFNGKNIFALANSTGRQSPRTNVARSTIEMTPEREHLLASIYRLYLRRISSEVTTLRERGFSITWAASEGDWLLSSFLRTQNYVTNREIVLEEKSIFFNELRQIDCVLVEEKDSRKLVSIDSLVRLGKFWTIDSASYSSADSLVKEVRGKNPSALSILNLILGESEADLSHVDMLRCNQRSGGIVDELIAETFQVDFIKVLPEMRRLDLRWSNIAEQLWEKIAIQDDQRRKSTSTCYLQIGEIEVESPLGQIAIFSLDTLFILKNSDLNKFMCNLLEKLSRKSLEETMILSETVSLLNTFFNYKERNREEILEIIDNRFERTNSRSLGKIIWSKVDKDELISTIERTKFTKYDTTIWYRRNFY